jgi:hypothetical protein
MDLYGPSKKKCWLLDIECMLHKIGMGNLWVMCAQYDIDVIVTVKNRLQDIVKQEWWSEVVNNGRLKSYHMYKLT